MKIIETELRKIKAVSKVKHYGIQQEQIAIYLDNAKLAYYGVRPITVRIGVLPPTRNARESRFHQQPIMVLCNF